MKKVLISLLVVLGLLATTAVVTRALTTDHGPSYYGSNYQGNWANQYGYGYSDGSGIGGTGGSGYVGAGAGVQTNPKYNTDYTDDSCVGKYQSLDGTIFTQVHTLTGNRPGLWTDATCAQFVLDMQRNILTTKWWDPMAWARSTAGPWHDIDFTPPVNAIDMIGGLKDQAKWTEVHGSPSILRGDMPDKQDIQNVCDFAYNALVPYHNAGILTGDWFVQIYLWGSSRPTCNRQLPNNSPVTTTTTTTAPVSPVTSSTTTTTAAPVSPVTSSTTTTTAPKPVVTTTTTTPPPTTTTTTTPSGCAFNGADGNPYWSSLTAAGLKQEVAILSGEGSSSVRVTLSYSSTKIDQVQATLVDMQKSRGCNATLSFYQNNQLVRTV